MGCTGTSVWSKLTPGLRTLAHRKWHLILHGIDRTEKKNIKGEYHHVKYVWVLK